MHRGGCSAYECLLFRPSFRELLTHHLHVGQAVVVTRTPRNVDPVEESVDGDSDSVGIISLVDPITQRLITVLLPLSPNLQPGHKEYRRQRTNEKGSCQF